MSQGKRRTKLQKKSHQKKSPEDIPHFIFTPESIGITAKALKLFEQPLQYADHSNVKVLLAQEMLQQIRWKLNTISDSATSCSATTFDYNERIVIFTAIQMYILEIRAPPVTPLQVKELEICRNIVSFFNPGNLSTSTQD